MKCFCIAPAPAFETLPWIMLPSEELFHLSKNEKPVDFINVKIKNEIEARITKIDVHLIVLFKIFFFII